MNKINTIIVSDYYAKNTINNLKKTASGGGIISSLKNLFNIEDSSKYKFNRTGSDRSEDFWEGLKNSALLTVPGIINQAVAMHGISPREDALTDEELSNKYANDLKDIDAVIDPSPVDPAIDILGEIRPDRKSTILTGNISFNDSAKPTARMNEEIFLHELGHGKVHKAMGPDYTAATVAGQAVGAVSPMLTGLGGMLLGSLGYAPSKDFTNALNLIDLVSGLPTLVDEGAANIYAANRMREDDTGSAGRYGNLASAYGTYANKALAPIVSRTLSDNYIREKYIED